MEDLEIRAALEAVLFAAGDAVELDKLADIVDVDKRSLADILRQMAAAYEAGDRGIQLIRLEDSYQLCTKGSCRDYVSRLVEPRRRQSLSNAAIEVLAVVAYRQPVTRNTIEHIRGVNCDYIVNRLIERNLIEEVGRLDAPGRPILFGTTQEFLRCFGIESLSQLPDFLSFGAEIDPADLTQIDEEAAAMHQTAAALTEKKDGGESAGELEA